MVINSVFCDILVNNENLSISTISLEHSFFSYIIFETFPIFEFTALGSCRRAKD